MQLPFCFQLSARSLLIRLLGRSRDGFLAHFDLCLLFTSGLQDDEHFENYGFLSSATRKVQHCCTSIKHRAYLSPLLPPSLSLAPLCGTEHAHKYSSAASTDGDASCSTIRKQRMKSAIHGEHRANAQQLSHARVQKNSLRKIRSYWATHSSRAGVQRRSQQFRQIRRTQASNGIPASLCTETCFIVAAIATASHNVLQACQAMLVKKRIKKAQRWLGKDVHQFVIEERHQARKRWRAC